MFGDVLNVRPFRIVGFRLVSAQTKIPFFPSGKKMCPIENVKSWYTSKPHFRATTSPNPICKMKVKWILEFGPIGPQFVRCFNGLQGSVWQGFRSSIFLVVKSILFSNKALGGTLGTPHYSTAHASVEWVKVFIPLELSSPNDSNEFFLQSKNNPRF